MEDLTYRFEVLLSGEQWVPYSAAALGVDDDDVDAYYAGDARNFIDDRRDPLEFARHELDQALAAFSAELPGLDGFHGVRVLVWEGDTATGEPVVLLRATDEQLAVGRLRRVAAGVPQALELVEQARRRLRAQVIEADTADRLGRNQIAREIDNAWSRRLVLQFLGGHDLIRDVRWALPADWPRQHRDGYDEFDGREEWERLLGPFRCGPVQLDLTLSGQVQLRITDDEDPPTFRASEEEEAAYHARVRQRVTAAAETVVATLTRRGLQLRTAEDDRDADIATLVAAGHVLVARPTREAEPRRMEHGLT